MGVLSKLRNTACLLSGHGIEIRKDVWEREYRQGDWTYLRGLEQLPRYHVLAGYIRYLRPGAAVLDVGCGDGLLQRTLAPDGYCRYLGLDLSEEAVAAARRSAEPHAAFHACDAATWEPTATFDFIVFNEALCYFHDPVAVLHRYEPALTAGGLFLVSLYWRLGNTRPLWKKILRAYPALHATHLKSGSAGRWQIRVLGRPGTTADALRPCGVPPVPGTAPGSPTQPARPL